MVLRQPFAGVKSTAQVVVCPTGVGHVALSIMTAVRSEIGLLEFVGRLQLSDLPASTQARLSLLLTDMAAVCVSGRPAPAARIALDYAHDMFPAPEASSLLDDSRLGVAGAAFANGMLANVLDFDDGHRLTKGHPGAVVIPAALAVAQFVDASVSELLTAVVIGYEVAIRAGIALHARDPTYHASGAWGGVGAAAAAARLIGLDQPRTLAALGLAEYHAPIAPIMRSCAEPQMTKDACAWGASVGVSSALLAARGFTSVRPEFLDAELGDLGERWALEELYIKTYPCCRWSQGAIAATLAARGERPLEPGAVRRVRVRTFAAADGLAKAVPVSTEEAQYSLLWPVACALVHGHFGVGDVLGPFQDEEVEAIFERIEVEVVPDLTAAFPDRRLTAVEIECHDGRHLRAGPVEAPGEPDDPGLPALARTKVAALIDPALDLAAPTEGGLRDQGCRQLLGMLCHGSEAAADG
jgi:2-methylcitrate dehydratase PrpD